MANEYKHMGEFLKDDEVLRDLLHSNHCLVKGNEITVVTSATAFQVLAALTARGYRLYNPGNLAQAWGISRQAVNNAINRGLLVTIHYKGGFTFDYKYVLFESIEAQNKRAERRRSTPEGYFGGSAAAPIVEESERDAAGWVQTAIALSSHPAEEGLTATEIKERDGICQEWRECSFRGTCFNQAINYDCICQKDEGAIDLSSPRQGSTESFDLVAAHEGLKAEVVAGLDRVLAANKKDERPTAEELRKKNFKEGEVKILRAGFALVLYDREQKTVYRSYPDPRRGWAPVGVFPTYAAAEHKVAELLEDDNVVRVDFRGLVVEGQKRLWDAGFQFFRSEGIMAGHGRPRIKIGPSWRTFQKFETREEVVEGWAELMKDEKALEG